MENKAAETNVRHLTDDSFRSEVLESDGAVMVDFWADWCGPCHALAPTIEELARDFEGSVKVAKLEIDENPKYAMAYGIRSVPTVLIFRGGQVVDAVIGVHPKETYEEALKKVA